jgi:hypothetical protein
MARKKGRDAAAESPVISIAAHPRATRSIRRTKAWAGLAGFVIVAFLSQQAGVPAFEVGVRALVAGLALYFAAWAVSLVLWKHLVLEEARLEAERIREEHEERLRQIREAAEAAGEAAAAGEAGEDGGSGDDESAAA